jgi:glycosyltransferase involved in cell wall biosynthesis
MTPFSAYGPCYNDAKTISQALSSLQRQSLPTSELVLINDGSSDGSAAIAHALGVDVGLDPSLQVISGVSNRSFNVEVQWWSRRIVNL